MLQVRLQEQFPAEVPRLHRKAARWYREQNDPVDAIYHLLAGKSWEEAAALIESVALHELEQSGEDSRLLRWLQQLPEAVVQQHGTLLAVYIRLASIALPSAEVESLLARVETNLSSTPPENAGPVQETLDEIEQIRRVWAENDQDVWAYLQVERMIPRGEC